MIDDSMMPVGYYNLTSYIVASMKLGHRLLMKKLIIFGRKPNFLEEVQKRANVPDDTIFYGILLQRPSNRIKHFTEHTRQEYRDCSPTDLLKSNGAGEPFIDKSAKKRRVETR